LNYPKRRGWGKNTVFSVEMFVEGKTSYIDLDQFIMSQEELDERKRLRLKALKKEEIGGCCGLFRAKRERR
jgi:hypothetical protein